MRRVWILAIWSGLALFDATQTVTVMRAEGMHHDWLRLFCVRYVTWLPWMLATPAVIAFFARTGSYRSVPAVLFHVAAPVAIDLVTSVWQALLDVWFNPYADVPPPVRAMPIFVDHFWNGLLSAYVLYAMVVIAQQAAKTAELRDQLGRAELKTLRAQIEPHFLFNALSGIAGLVREGRTAAAVSMIVAFSDFLRKTLGEGDRAELALEEECRFVESYLRIAQMRFGERLHWRIDVPEQLRTSSVPNLILQPLVENAVKYGVEGSLRGSTIEVAATQEDRTLVLLVSNDGPLLAPDAREGVGLRNVRARLATLYGNRSSLQMRNGAAGGVEVRVAIPL